MKNSSNFSISVILLSIIILFLCNIYGVIKYQNLQKKHQKLEIDFLDEVKRRLDTIKENEYLKKLNTEEIETKKFLTDWDKIQLVQNEIVRSKYTEKYACFDFAKEFKEKLEKRGIRSKIEIVKNNSNENYHSIISIQIDPRQNGIVYYSLENTIDQCVKSTENKIFCKKGIVKVLEDETEAYVKFNNFEKGEENDSAL